MELWVAVFYCVAGQPFCDAMAVKEWESANTQRSEQACVGHAHTYAHNMYNNRRIRAANDGQPLRLEFGCKQIPPPEPYVPMRRY
jgi:hypothetical protein